MIYIIEKGQKFRLKSIFPKSFKFMEMMQQKYSDLFSNDLKISLSAFLMGKKRPK
jgi:hypothetical protein